MTAFDTLLSWLVKNDYYTESSINTIPFITIPYSNPLITASSDYRCDIAIPIDCHVPTNELGIFSGVIPGGDFAVLNYIGQREVHGFVHAISKVITDFLPKTEWEPLPAPALFEHVNSPLFVPETELITKIYIPLSMNNNN